MLSVSSCRSTVRRVIPAVALSLCLTVAAAGQSRVLIAQDDPNLPNRFTVNFPPELGGPQTADIRSTTFVLRFDESAEAASMQSYYQDVDPLNIGGFSTGDISVKLGFGKSGGEYNETGPNEAIFVTNQPFDIFFTGDLRIFGIESPFKTESSAEGHVLFDSNSTGTIAFDWEGDGELNNPRDPENPFKFTYQCEVNSNFVESTACDNIRKIKSRRCQKGNAEIVVVGRGNLDGEYVALDVDNAPVVMQFNGRKAKATVHGVQGGQNVRLIAERDGCQPSVKLCD